MLPNHLLDQLMKHQSYSGDIITGGYYHNAVSVFSDDDGDRCFTATFVHP